MSTKSKSINLKTDINQDERLKKVSKLKLLLNRPELGALGGAILVFIFFGIVAGDTGMFSAYGMLNFLDVSANLGIIAIAAAMLMIGGEFDLSIGSMIGFAGICIAIPAIYWGWPLWMSIGPIVSRCQEALHANHHPGKTSPESLRRFCELHCDGSWTKLHRRNKICGTRH